MKKEAARLYEFRDPKARLTAALDTLEQFANLHSDETHSHTLSLPKESLGLSKMITLAKCFVGSTFSESFRKKLVEEQDIQEKNLDLAIEEVKRYHPLVCNHSAPEEKVLSERALHTIQKFNQTFEHKDEGTSAWHKHLLKFLIKKSRKPLSMHKVELTQVFKAEKHAESHKVQTFILQRTLSDSFTEREADAFRMKAISSMKNYGVLFPSLKETLHFLQETPILCSLSENDSTGNVPSSSVVSLQQTLSPFPGETIILKGSFMRDPNTRNCSTPVPGSFEVVTESVQTGFPYPSQHYGWTLTDVVLPSQPLHPDQLMNVYPLLKKKKDVAKEFLNKTFLLEKSRQIIERKQQLINDNKEAFVALHLSLCQAILDAAPKPVITTKVKDSISQFFRWVQELDSPFTMISTVYLQINQLYLNEPHDALLDAWLNQIEQDLLIDHSKIRFEAARKILIGNLKATVASNEEDQQKAMQFIQNFGPIIGMGGINLILMGFSETIDYVPPQLLDFEKKLHAVAFRQLRAFLKELRGELSYFSFETIAQTIESDIALFQQKNIHDPLCSEVEKYYLSRYTERKGC